MFVVRFLRLILSVGTNRLGATDRVRKSEGTERQTDALVLLSIAVC